MKNSRDSGTTIQLDDDVRAVLEFMQQHIPATKLVGIAENLPGLARLLWGHYPQEPCRAASLAGAKKDQGYQSQSASSELSLAQ